MALYYLIITLIFVSDTLRKLNLIPRVGQPVVQNSNTAELFTKRDGVHIKNFNLISYWFVTYLKRISRRRKGCSIFQFVSPRRFNEIATSLIAIC